MLSSADKLPAFESVISMSLLLLSGVCIADKLLDFGWFMLIDSAVALLTTSEYVVVVVVGSKDLVPLKYISEFKRISKFKLILIQMDILK